MLTIVEPLQTQMGSLVLIGISALFWGIIGCLPKIEVRFYWGLKQADKKTQNNNFAALESGFVSGDDNDCHEGMQRFSVWAKCTTFELAEL